MGDGHARTAVSERASGDSRARGGYRSPRIQPGGHGRRRRWGDEQGRRLCGGSGRTYGGGRRKHGRPGNLRGLRGGRARVFLGPVKVRRLALAEGRTRLCLEGSRLLGAFALGIRSIEEGAQVGDAFRGREATACVDGCVEGRVAGEGQVEGAHDPRPRLQVLHGYRHHPVGGVVNVVHNFHGGAASAGRGLAGRADVDGLGGGLCGIGGELDAVCGVNEGLVHGIVVIEELV
ncbi:hypothetical protein GSI_12610 [Ganoderma sinense ZZ0214-1]|uniref:Uncharacterized protein n=1 Tax=Ganoderma sinense ZZ0214-1 TaxID=1077348 RepID=A0A2G8RTB7_9APHY|nr:hypothetical protein GSI_12610 [Ganoderma sinense ZZ0214-1]